MTRRVRALVADLALISCATVLALLLRSNLDVTFDELRALMPYAGITVTVAIPILVLTGLDSAIWRYSSLAIYVRVLAAVVVIVAVATGIGFLYNRLDGIARALPILQGLLMSCAMIGTRVLARARFRARKALKPAEVVSAHGSVLVVGVNALTDLYLRSVSELARDKVRIAGVLSANERHLGRLVSGFPVLGAGADIARIIDDLAVHGVRVDRIVVAEVAEKLDSLTREALERIEESSDIVLDYLIDRLVAAPHPSPTSKADVQHALVSGRDANGGVHFVQYAAGYRVMKRAMDIVLSAATIVILSPIFAVAAILVALDAGSPVMFWQQRPGRGGVPFRLYKFRTMGPKRDDSGRLRSDDERMSRVGWWLRRLRLDELPQLFNILVGDMSFVGPRPLLPVDQPEDAAARLQVRPGLTGWAQICGGRTISVAKKTELDLWYIRNASLRLDLVIMLRTVPFMIRGERKGTVAKEQDAARELDQGAIAGSLGRPQ